MQPSLKEKQDIVLKIRGSKTFSNATTSSALLQYLHDATINGNNLKEGVIDMEFYGSKEFVEKSNPRVRVNVYNLRKKLSAYYEEEGRSDLWKLQIDKGQYSVSFIKMQQSKIVINKLSWKLAIPYTGLIGAILVIIFTNIPPKTPVLWRSFFTNNKPINLYIGDAFGFIGNTITGRKGWSQDYGINNIEEFYTFIDKNPDLKDIIQPAKFTFATAMASISTQYLQQFFQEHHQAFSIRYSSRSSVAEISEGNSMYIGTFHNDNKFINFFNNADPYFKITSNFLILSNHPQLRDTAFNIFISGDLQEYAVVSKYPGVGDTEHFVFFSQHDIGVSATVEYFTNADSLQNFTQTYLKDKKYFTAVFNVQGQDRINTGLNLEMIATY